VRVRCPVDLSVILNLATGDVTVNTPDASVTAELDPESELTDATPTGTPVRPSTARN
jgi:hypothetical protein